MQINQKMSLGVVLLIGLVLGAVGTAVSYQRFYQRSMLRTLDGEAVRAATWAINLRNSDVRSCIEEMESDLQRSIVMFVELHGGVIPEGEYKGIQIAARYWRTHRLNTDSGPLQNLMQEALGRIPN